MNELYRKNLLGVLFVAACLMGLVHGYAQDNSNDMSLQNVSTCNMLDSNTNRSIELEDWNLLNSFSLTSGGQQGVATDGNYIYTCSWQETPSGGFSFYKYTMQGDYIEGFNIDGAGEIIDLTYDGQYFYGSNRTNYLYKMDFTNKTLVSTISTTCTSIWFCTYYPETDGFWVGQSNLRLINRNGQTIQTASVATGTMGIAYYKDNNNIDHLYLFSQGANNDQSLVYDYNITTNTLGTDPIFNFETLPGYDTGNAEAGGAFIGNYNGKTAFFGNVQQLPNLIGIYELEATTPGSDYATVILTVGDVWGDGTGYQMLIDADATAYGSVIPTSGPLTASGDASSEVYAQFEYKIPVNADGSLTTQNIVFNNSVAIHIPAGVYDWCITNPTPDDRMWIAGPNGNIGGRQNDFTFEAGKTYEFEPKLFGQNDGVDLTITGSSSSYMISASANPSEGGTITGTGPYEGGQTCTLTAVANPNFTFTNWTENGSVVSYSASYSFVVEGDRTLVAHFQSSSYTISLSADPVNGGTVSGGGTFNYGDECTISASPSAGYTFLKWTNGQEDVTTALTHTFIVTSSATYVAHFTQIANGYSISASVNPSDGGSVTGSGIYAEGITCTLTATANPGYRFVNWTENGVIQWSTAQYEFIVNRDRVLVANFAEANTYTITALAGANGTISPQGDIQVNPGADQSFVMIPDYGCHISKVLVDGVDIGAVDSYTFTNVNRDHTIFVSFSGIGVDEAQVLDISVYPNPAQDMVLVEGDGIETIALYDMLGTCLFSRNYSLGKILDVSSLPKGIYVLMLTTQNERIRYKKLVVE